MESEKQRIGEVLRSIQLVRYRRQDVWLKGVWSGPAALQLFARAIGNVAKLRS
jgi:acetoacetate decarboxylase